MSDYRSNCKPISTDERLLAILEELEELNRNMGNGLKELKKGSTASAPPAPATKRKAK